MKLKKKLLLALSICTVIHPSYAVEVEASGLNGQFSVSPSGAAVYSIPLALPQGVNGVQPTLGVVYNSQAGYGLLGQGGALSGISALTRCGQTMAIDGVNRPIKGDTDDRLCLEGQELLLLSGDSYWADNAIYTTEIKNFTKIQRVVEAGNKYFQVITKDGQVMRYGTSDNSRELAGNDTAFDPNLLIAWYLDVIYKREYPDTKVSYYYKVISPGDFSDIPAESRDNMVPKKLLSKIYYVNTGFTFGVTIALNYRGVDLRNRLYAPGGILLENDFLLKSVSVCDTTVNAACGESSYVEQGSLISAYKFDYQDLDQSAAKTRLPKLTSITACGMNDQCLKPVRLSYSPVNLLLEKTSLSFAGVADTDRVIHGDFNGDGLADLIATPPVADPAPVPFPDYQLLRLFLANTSGFDSGIVLSRNTYPVQVSDSPPKTQEDLNDLVAFDFTGTGLLTLITEVVKTATASEQATGDIPLVFKAFRNANTNGGIAMTNETYPRTYDYPSKYSSKGWVNTKQPSSVPKEAGASTANFSGDINGDGIADWIRVSDTRLTYFLGGVNTPSSQRLGSILFTQAYPGNKIIADVDGDGISDVIVSSPTSPQITTIFIKNKAVAATKTFPYDPKNAGYPLFGDFNGDGLLDFVVLSGKFPYPANDLASQHAQLYYSKGDGTFKAMSVRNLPADMSPNGKQATWVADFNGDGRSDILGWGQNDFTVLLAGKMDDFGWVDQQIVSLASNGSRIFPDDYTGDGRSDVLGLDGSNASLWSNKGNNGELNQIDTYSGSVKIQFARLTDSSVYTRDYDAIVPQNDIKDSRQVVKSVQFSNGVGGFSEPLIYSYGGLKLDRDRGSLGFRWMRSTVERDAARSSSGGRWSKVQETGFRQDFPFIGIIDYVKTSTCDLLAQPASCGDLSKTQNSWQSKSYNLPANMRTYFPYIDHSQTDDYRIAAMYSGGAVVPVGKTESPASQHPEPIPVNSTPLVLPEILDMLVN